MDILAGMLAYAAGIGAVVAALAISFSVLFATPKEPLQGQAAPQSASAMLMRTTPARPGMREARAKQSAKESTRESTRHSEKNTAAAALPRTARPTAAAHDVRGKHALSAAQARRLIQEERARRWAYQQNSSFENRFLGYAD